MGAKPVQISLDEDLLRQIDARPEVREQGRSAFIREAIQLYLRAVERRAVDELIERAYRGNEDELLAEVAELMETQAWPDE
jgi:metal-responsive CopG/Arc/MetJ family transcriptional regulator